MNRPVLVLLACLLFVSFALVKAQSGSAALGAAIEPVNSGTLGSVAPSGPAEQLNLTRIDQPNRASASPVILNRVEKSFQAHPEYKGSFAKAPCKNCTERVDRRTQHARYYHHNDNPSRFTIYQSYYPLHYKDAQGWWRTIDPNLQPKAGETHVYEAPNQPGPTRLDLQRGYTALQLKGGIELRTNQKVRFYIENKDGVQNIGTAKLTHHNTQVGSNGAIQQDIADATNREIIFDKGSIKTNYILKRKPDGLRTSDSYVVEEEWEQPRLTRWEMDRTAGAFAENGLWYGPVLLIHNNGDTLARLQRAEIWDSQAGNPARTIGGYRLIANGQRMTLQLVVLGEWLADPARVFPVTVDPRLEERTSWPQVIPFKNTPSATPGPLFNCADPANFCLTTMNVQLPSQAQLNEVKFQIEALNQASFNRTVTMAVSFFNPSCSISEIVFPGGGTGTVGGGTIGPGSSIATRQGDVITPYRMLLPAGCPEAKCDPQSIPFDMRTFQCGCPTADNISCVPADALLSCVIMQADKWIMIAEGNTVEPNVASSAGRAETMYICLGDVLEFQANAKFGVAPYTYNWTTGGAYDSLQINNQTGTLTHVPQSVGTYDYTITYNDACNNPNATTPITYTVIVRPGPEITVDSVKHVDCRGPGFIEMTIKSNNEPAACLTASADCFLDNPIDNAKVYDVSAVTIGSTPSAGGSRNPFRGAYSDFRIQYMYPASVLTTSIGMKEGKITNLSFLVSSKSTIIPYRNFTVKLGCTTDNGLSVGKGFITEGMRAVFFRNSYDFPVIPTGQWMSIALDNAYVWDGVSNLILEICYDNESPLGGNDNIMIFQYGAPAANRINTVLWSMDNPAPSSVGCALPAASGERNTYCFPAIRFDQCEGRQWNRNGIYYSRDTSIYNLNAALYEFFYVDPKGCSSPVTVRIDSIPSPELAFEEVCPDSGYNVIFTGTKGSPYYEFAVARAAAPNDTVVAWTRDTTHLIQAGTYNFILRDSIGCSDTLLNVVIADPLQLEVTDACPDPSIQLTATGGGGTPYTYYVDKGGPVQQTNETGRFLFDPQRYTLPDTFDLRVEKGACSFTIKDYVQYPVPTPLVTVFPCPKPGFANVVITSSGSSPRVAYSSTGGPPFAAVDTFILAPGDYVFAVFDSVSGCTVTAPQTVPQPLALVIDAPCPNDSSFSVRLNATGGSDTFEYTYDNGTSWVDSSEARLPAGIYQMGVRDADNNDCFIIEEVQIWDSLKFDVACMDASGVLKITNVTGGSSAFRYRLTNNAAYDETNILGSFVVPPALLPGAFDVSITFETTPPKACVVERAIFIFPELSLAFNGGCANPDGAIPLFATGGNPAKYEFYWQNGANEELIDSLLSPDSTLLDTVIAAPFTRTYYLTDAAACRDTLVVTVYPFIQPVVSNCPDADGNLIVTTEPAGADVQFAVQDSTIQTLPALSTYVAGDQTGVKNYTTPDDFGPAVELPKPYRFLISYGNQCISDVVRMVTAPLRMLEPELVCGVGSYTVTLLATGGLPVLKYAVVPFVGNVAPEPAAGDYDEDNTFDLAEGRYALWVRDSLGCVDSVSVNVNPAVVIEKPVNVCPDENDRIYITVTGGSGVYEYATGANPQNGSFAPATVNPPADNVLIFDNASTLFANATFLTIREVGGAGCLDTLRNLQVFPRMALTFQPCPNAAGELVFDLRGGKANYNLRYYDTSQPDPADTSEVIMDTPLTSFNIELQPPKPWMFIVQDANGCRIDVPHTNVANLVATITVDSINCPNDKGRITVKALGGTKPYVWELMDLGDNNAETGTFTDDLDTTIAVYGGSAAELVAGSYRLVLSDANGCQFVTNMLNPLVIPVPAELRATVATTAISCFGRTDGTLTLTIVGSVGTGSTVTINGPAGPNAADTELPIVNNVATVFGNLAAGNYTVTITNTSGCAVPLNPMVYTVADKAEFIATVTKTDITCNGEIDGKIEITDVFGAQGPVVYTLTEAGGATPDITTAGVAANLPAGSYTLTITDSFGCTVTLTNPYLIVEPTALTAVVQSPIPISCSGTVQGIIRLTPAGGTAPYTVVLFEADGTTEVATDDTAPYEFRNLAERSYQLRITDANGCVILRDNNGALYTVGKVDQMQTVVDSLSISCYNANDGEMIVTVEGASGAVTLQLLDQDSVSIGTPIALPADPYVHTYTGLAPGTYKFYAVDIEGCTADFGTNLFPLSNPPEFTAEVTATSISCFGEEDGSIAVTNVVGSRSRELTYNLYLLPADDLQQSASKMVANSEYDSHLYPINNKGTYRVEVSYPSGRTGVNCIATLDPDNPFAIDEPLEISATVVISKAISCNGGSDGEITVTATGRASFTLLLLDRDNGNAELERLPLGVTAFTITDLPAGNYTVVVENPAAPLCSYSEDIAVAEPAPFVADPVLVDLVDTESCADANDGAFGLSLSGGTTPYLFTYEFTPSSPNDPSEIKTGEMPAGNRFIDLKPGNYSLTITDQNGCGEATLEVVINAKPVFAGSLDIITGLACEGVAAAEIQITTTGGIEPIVYTLTDKDGLELTPGSTPGQYTDLSKAGIYTATATDADGCPATLTPAEVDLVAPDAIVLGTPEVTDVLCFGESTGEIKMTATGGVGALTYILTGGNLVDPRENATGVFIQLEKGSYTLTVRDSKTPAPCEKSLPEPVVIGGPDSAPELVDVPTLTPLRCFGDASGRITLNVIGGTPPYQYAMDSSANPANFQSAPEFTGLNSGVYYLAVRDANGCIVAGLETSFEVTQPEQVLIAGSDVFDCSPAPLLPYVATFSATPANGTWSSVPDGIIRGSGNGEAVIQIDNYGEYVLNYEVDMGGGNICGATTPLNIAIYSVNAGEDQEFCIDPSRTSHTNTFQPAGGIWSSLGGRATIDPTTGEVNLSGLTAGAYTFLYTVSTNPTKPCDAQYTIILNPQPEAEFMISEATTTRDGVPTWFAEYDEITFTTTSADGSGFSYTWDMGDGSEYTDRNTRHTYKEEGDYTVTLSVEDTRGCRAEIDSTVHVEMVPIVQIDNVFTPNGDGVNDVLRVQPHPDFEIEMHVFNRTGVRVFTWSQSTPEWDGSYSGGEAPEGTYYYIIEYTSKITNKSDSMKGHLSLLR